MRPRVDRDEGGLDLTPAMFHILLALCDHDRHGYGIMQEVAARTGELVHMAPGTLYRTLKILLAAGYIVESDERPDPALDDERRRYYRVTPLGRAAAEEEAQRLEQLVEQARAKHLLRRDALSPAEGGV